jgi:LPXTG-motif cell wall-anchored protein
VTKVVTGEGAPTVDETYRICLTGPTPPRHRVCKTVEGEGTLAFEGLVPGRYAVTEPDAAGKDYTATFTPTNAIVDVTIDATAKATVTNTYTEEESLPPPPEVLPPTVPLTPVTPVTPTVAPATAVAPATTTQVAAQTALPATGSEGGIAAIAAILLATGVALTLVSRHRQPQQA